MLGGSGYRAGGRRTLSDSVARRERFGTVGEAWAVTAIGVTLRGLHLALHECSTLRRSAAFGYTFAMCSA